MYEDNAWPETAPIQTFVPERKRPMRVQIAFVAILASAAAAVLSSLFHLAAEGTPGASFFLDIPGMVMLVLAVLVAAWLGFLSRTVFKGVKWSLNVAQWTAGGVAVLYGLFAPLAMPGSGVRSGVILLGIYVFLLFATALGGLVTVLCLLGKRTREYFDPPIEPSPFHAQQQQQPPLGGHDADWIPPAQRQQPPGYGNYR